MTFPFQRTESPETLTIREISERMKKYLAMRYFFLVSRVLQRETERHGLSQKKFTIFSYLVIVFFHVKTNVVLPRETFAFTWKNTIS